MSAVSEPRVIVILTQQDDPTADYLVDELNRREVSLFRCDAAEFPQHLTMAARFDGFWTGTLRTAYRRVHLDEVSGIYYRRPTEFSFADGMSEPERSWALAEARLGFGGLLASLPRWLNHPARLGFGGLLASLPRWLNHPTRMAYARYKPVQLQAATASGLRAPRTLLTNEPREVEAFAELVGEVVYKPMSAGGVVEEGTYRTLYATRLPARDACDPAVSLTAHLFQEWVEHDHAVRLTVVDDELFAAEIHAHSAAARVDWRADYGALTYETTCVPDDIRRGVLALMQTLGLRFGALDFLVTPAGDWVFLELNPNGQWAWIEEETGLPIAAAIADALTEGSPRVHRR